MYCICIDCKFVYTFLSLQSRSLCHHQYSAYTDTASEEPLITTHPIFSYTSRHSLCLIVVILLCHLSAYNVDHLTKKCYFLTTFHHAYHTFISYPVCHCLLTSLLSFFFGDGGTKITDIKIEQDRIIVSL